MHIINLRLFTLLFCIIFIQGCAEQQPAEIVYNHSGAQRSENEIIVSSSVVPASGEVKSHSLEKKEQFEDKPSGVLKENNTNASSNKSAEKTELPEAAPVIEDNALKNDEPKEIVVNEVPKYNMPVDGEIITNFGEATEHGKSNGIDIKSIPNQEVKSISKSKVIYSGNNEKFGNLVIAQLEDTDLYAAYANLDDLLLKQGDILEQGQVVGNVGSNGIIHFAIRKGKIPIDPLKYLNIK